ncbi:MAG: MltA domain-containing protein, partial [Hyphomicrobiales bacterium]|nr:MltA domain-containing protein [Hyphomicrobiales bacterium]
TGYYEPEIAGATAPSPAFPAPVFARPSDLVAFAPGDGPAHLDPAFAGARRRPGGALEPYPDRAAIYADALGPGAEVAAWLEDDVEVFMAQVQGSARLRLDGGGTARLVYDGRNGRPYVSIGASLIADGSIAPAAMSLANLKAWLRAAGLKPGEAGRARLERNPSYVFFRLERDVDPALGPIGGAGLALTPLRSIAVDRTLHAYGTPIFVGAELPWHEPSPEPFRRLTIAQDTGSAIVGPARFDLFMGSGDEAGARAGDIRHEGRAWALEAI